MRAVYISYLKVYCVSSVWNFGINQRLETFTEGCVVVWKYRLDCTLSPQKVANIQQPDELGKQTLIPYSVLLTERELYREMPPASLLLATFSHIHLNTLTLPAPSLSDCAAVPLPPPAPVH